MSTPSVASGKKQYVDFDEFIDYQLNKTRNSIKLTDIITALVGVGVLCLAYLLLFVVLDHWVIDGGFSTTTRWIMLGGLLLVSLTWIVWKVWLPSLKHITGIYAARNIESAQPGLKHGLLNLVDLKASGKEISPSIRTALEKRAAVTLSKFDVDEAVDRRPLMWLSYALLALVVLFCLYALFSPKTISGSVWRAFFPSSRTAVDTTIKIERVTTFLNGEDTPLPAEISIPARSKVEVVVDLAYSGDAPESVTLYYTTQDGKFDDVPVPMRADADEEKRYRARLTGEYGRGILQNMTYRLVAGDAKAGPFQIEVQHPPIATVTGVTYHYPDYMERETKSQPGGHLETWERTRVDIKATTDQHVSRASLVLHDSENLSQEAGRIPMTIRKGTQLSVTLKDELSIRADGGYPRFYHIACEDKNGLTDPRPVLYGITLHRDLPPKVVLVDPEENEIDIPANTELLPLLYRANDPDFKIKFVTLRAELTRNGQQKPTRDSEPLFDGNQKTVQKSYEWQLVKFRPQVGDSLRFRLEARDNKTPVGNLGFSRWVTIRFVEPVSKDEVKQRLDADRKRQEQRQKQDQDPDNQPNQQQPDNNGGNDPMSKDNGNMGDQKQDGNETKNGNKTTKKQSPKKQGGGDGNKQRTEKPEQNENPDNKNGMGQGTRPEKINPDGSNDDQLLKKLNQERIKEQQKKESRKKKQKPNGQKPDGKEPGQNGDQPSEKQPPGKKPESMQDGMTSENPMKNTPNSENGTEKKTQNMQDGKTPKAKKQPSDTKKTKTSPKDNANGNDPNGTPGDGMANKKKKSPSDGTATKPDKKMPKESQPGMGSESDPNPSKKSAKKSNGSANGMKKRTTEEGPAKKKKATGEETGMAKSQKDPNANPTQSQKPNELMTDPKEKKTTRKRSGEADPNLPKKKETTKPKTPNNGMSQSTETKPGPKTPAKKTPDGTPPENPNAKTVKKKSPTSPEGLPKKPNQGMGDSKTPMKTGNHSSNPQNKSAPKNGAPKPGGMPQNPMGSKTAPGSKSSPKNGMKNSNASPMSGAKPSPMGGSNPMTNPSGNRQPGSGDPTTSKKPNNNDSMGPGVGEGPQRRPETGPNDTVPETPEAQSEYGKKAANLVLDDLQNKLNRGKIDEKWLKEHGFDSKAGVKNFIDRVRSQINTPATNKGQELQRNAFFRSLAKDQFQTERGVRKGSNVRQRTVDGVGANDDKNIPPHLKQYYKSFTESVGKRQSPTRK